MQLDLIISRENIYIRSNEFVGTGLQTLVIKRNNAENEIAIFEMSEEEIKANVDNSLKEQVQIYGVMGILPINDVQHLCVITEIANVGYSFDNDK